MRTTPAGHAAAEATLFSLRDDLVAAVDNDDRSRAEIAYAAGVTEEELDGLLTQDRIDFAQAMTVAAGLTTGAQIAFLTEYAPNGGIPTITGTPTQGQLLTAVPGAYTGSPTPTLAYVWKRCDEDGVEVEDIDAPGVAVVTTSVAGVAAVNEQQTVTLTGTPEGGTFTVTHNGHGPTAGVAYDASASTLKTAMINAGIGTTDDLGVTGAAGGPWTVEFKGALGGTNVAQMTASGAGLTGGTSPDVAVATSVPGVVAVKEVQVVTFYAGEGSTFTLTAESQSATSAIDLDVATADDVEARLDVAGVEGDIQVTGAVGGPFTLTYGNVTAPGNRTPVAVDQSNLTAGSKYLLVADDVDGTIRVEVTATNSQGEEANLSEPTDVIAGL